MGNRQGAMGKAGKKVKTNKEKLRGGYKLLVMGREIAKRH